MNVLTDDIRHQIKNGWRVGIAEDGCIAVFEVVSRLGNAMMGDEKWRLFPKGSPYEDGPVTQNPRLFFALDAEKVVYCHSRINGLEYVAEAMGGVYG